MTISLLTLSHPFMSHSPGSNWRPARYECAALPTELKWRTDCKYTKKLRYQEYVPEFLCDDLNYSRLSRLLFLGKHKY